MNSNRLCGHRRSYISHEVRKLHTELGTLGLYLLATFWQAICIVQCFEHCRKQLGHAKSINCIWLWSPILKYMRCTCLIMIQKLLHVESRIRVLSSEEVLVSWRRVLETALATWFCKDINPGREICIDITTLLYFPLWRQKPCSSLLPNKPQRFFRVLRWWNSLEGV